MGENKMAQKTISVRLSNNLDLIALIDADDADLILPLSWYSVSSRGAFYAKTGKNTRMHRLILGMTNPNLIVDHINGNGLDNRKANLRIVDVKTNVQNRQRSRAGNKCPGVYKDRGKWRGQVTVDYKKYNVGTFACEDDAIVAVNEFRKKLGRPQVLV
jgi:hypothetical protein